MCGLSHHVAQYRTKVLFSSIPTLGGKDSERRGASREEVVTDIRVQLGDQLRGQLWDQLGGQLEGQLRRDT
jgi:hypothetical protein